MQYGLQKPDFAQIAQRGGFDDYEKPLGNTDAGSLHKKITNPTFAGDKAYVSGPYILERFEINLPSDLISAQSRTIKDAIQHYMPERELGAWMHSSRSGDFMNDGAFRELVGTVHFPKEITFGKSSSL